MSANETGVYIEEYSEKSFVVRGDTRPHRESLKALGGKWANRLTDKSSGEKFGAWLFWSGKHPELDDWIKGGCKAVQGSESQYAGRSDENYSRLESRLAAIEATLSALNKTIEDIRACVIDGEIIEEEEEDAAPKRLLGR